MTALPINNDYETPTVPPRDAPDGQTAGSTANDARRGRESAFSPAMSPRRTRTDRPEAGSDGLNPEAAVRLYLEYLANPDSFDNASQVERLAKKAESTKDVLEKLSLFRDSRRARTGVGKEFRANFVRLAKRYADETDLAAEDFRAFGVSQAVLSEAGLVGRGGGDRRTRGTSSGAARTGGRSKGDLAAIREWASLNGYKVSTRGRIAADIVSAYEAAH